MLIKQIQFLSSDASLDIGAFHTGLWIQIQCRSGIQIQRALFLHTASSCVLCCVTLRVRQCVSSSPAVQYVLSALPCGAHATPHLIRIWDPDPVNPVSVPVWRAPIEGTWWHICVNQILIANSCNERIWHHFETGSLCSFIKLIDLSIISGYPPSDVDIRVWIHLAGYLSKM